MTTAKRIVEVLRERREMLGYRQTLIANALDVHKEEICMWERGYRIPCFDTLAKWAHELGLTIDIRDRMKP